jgi:transposase
VVEVEQWAEFRRMHFVLGVSIRETARRTGRDRNTVRRALRAAAAPRYSRPLAGSKLDPFKDEIHRLLKADGKLTGQRIRELIAPLGFDGGKTIVDDYLREVRPLFDPPRTFQRTIYRPGEICQFDLWEPEKEIAGGHGQTRKGWVVIACLGYRARAPARWSSPSRPRICCSGSGAVCCRWGRCHRRWSGIARRGCTPATAGRRTRSPGSAARRKWLALL